MSRLFLRMEEAIDSADPEAIGQVLQEIHGRRRPADLPAETCCLQLERQINRYDYDQARSTLQQMQQQQGGAG